MKFTMVFSNKFDTAIACFSLMLATGITLAADPLKPVAQQRFFIDEVQELYGLDEESAIQRLGNEQVASEKAAIIESFNLTGYAGSWFDPESKKLVVALSSPSHSVAVSALDAKIPVSRLIEATLRLWAASSCAPSAL